MPESAPAEITGLGRLGSEVLSTTVLCKKKHCMHIAFFLFKYAMREYREIFPGKLYVR